jgi:tetratricopeptide (TPR) repeat protein
MKYVYTNRWWPNPHIQYKAVFKIKLADPQENTFDVAEIRVVLDTSGVPLDTLARFTLTTDTLSTNYKEFTLTYSYANLPYENPGYTVGYTPPPGSDWIPMQGTTATPWLDGRQKIQFQVEWLGNAEIIVDYVEVYDGEENGIWENSFIGEFNYTQTVNRISTYNQYFATLNSSFYDKLKYYGTMDEPHTWDSFIPIRKVQHILDSLNTGKDLLVHFYPGWNNYREGKYNVLEKWVNIAQPKKLMFWYAPFTCDASFSPCDPYPREFTLNNFHNYVLQPAHLLQPDFYVTLQSWGTVNEITGDYSSYMTPTPAELSAGTMLSLAHGVKGIFYEIYYTYESVDPWLVEGLVDLSFTPTTNWNKVQELATRLKGKLGKTLLSLNYTGEFINMKYQEGPPPEDNEQDYLSIQHYGMSYYWHAGFFQKQNQPDNKHFLLANLRTGFSVTAKLTVSNNTNYQNLSFTDIEGGSGRVDTTIGNNSSITYFETMPAGEGRLYRVSPVVKYGGRLIYDEDVGGGMTLVDDMIIENGATLTIYSDYYARGNIIVKNGSIVNGENGKIHFQNGKKLIVEGAATINGISGDKLTIKFVGPETENGIVVDSAGSLIISNCIIEDAETGIKAMVDAGTINVQYVDFNDCQSSSVTLLGQTVGAELVRQVKYCTITNSQYGISAANLYELIIQKNYITNTDVGICLSNVSRVVVFGNRITTTTNSETLQGIFAESTGGEIYSNIISGHTYGIHLGNSSPDVGGNDITGCKFHGIYVGNGSLPNMVGRLISNPNNHLWYPISGYNKIYENGGYAGGGFDNDGSEIFISNANVKMKVGCNSIYDDREPSPPLEETELLMSGNGFFTITVQADSNHWGDTVYTARFGSGLNVDYEPYYTEPCPLPDGGGEDKLVTKTSAGEVIDTLYPVERSVGVLTENEILYSKAEELFITGEIESAEVFYDQIISSNDTLTNKLEAYSRKYETGKLLQRNPGYFSELQNTYESLIQTTEDTMLIKIFGQLAKLCLIGQTEYIPAIGEFDNIVQQNPGSEEAVYAEIDALTTALLVEGNDSTLNKGTLGKYLIKTSGDYFNKINGILRKNFGSEKETEEKKIIPEEYTLYQNYPNPFNPVTTIKYDLPKVGEVKLVVYDILGRKVKTLANQTQLAGRYEIQFDASSLASGVYIYQLRTKDFVNAKKMILLK